MKVLLLALLLTGCHGSCSVKINDKTPLTCGIEKAAHYKCIERLLIVQKLNREQALTNVCTYMKQEFPCKITQADLDSYSEFKCPTVTGCK